MLRSRVRTRYIPRSRSGEVQPRGSEYEDGEKEDKLRSAAPLGPFSVLVIASRGKMVEYCFLSLEHTLVRCTKSVGLQTAFRRGRFALNHSARRCLSAREIDWYFRFEEKSAGK